MSLLFEVILKFCFGCLERQTVSKNMKRTPLSLIVFSLAFVLRADCMAFDGSLKLIRY